MQYYKIDYSGLQIMIIENWSFGETFSLTNLLFANYIFYIIDQLKTVDLRSSGWSNLQGALGWSAHSSVWTKPTFI